MNQNKLKLAEQALASHKAQLRTAADKDSVKRSIAAMEARIRQMKTDQDNWRRPFLADWQMPF